MIPVSLPENLAPTQFEDVEISPGVIVAVQKATPLFRLWRGTAPSDTYRGKQVLDYDGRPAFAELYILWSLVEQGWQGVWIDTFGHRFRKGYWDQSPSLELPIEQASLLNRISGDGSSWSGSWDVFCWSGDRVLFLEAKWKSHDKLRRSQLRWLGKALDAGLRLSDFLIVEWSTHDSEYSGA